MNCIFYLTVIGIIFSINLEIIRSASPGDELANFRKDNWDLTKFLDLIEADPKFQGMIKYRYDTIFIPQNHAVEKFIKENPNKLTSETLLYHLVSIAKPSKDLGEESSIPTELSGNLPIWITKRNNQIYLNDARLIPLDKLVKMGDNVQLTHSIDRVLEPTVPINTSQAPGSPDARKFMEFSSQYTISAGFSTRAFYEQVEKSNKTRSFQESGKNTFFIPIDTGIQRKTNIDPKVIDGHIIFGDAIFIGVPFEGNNKDKSPPFQSSAFASNLPVNIVIEKAKNSDTYHVISEVVVNDLQTMHRKGRVQATILKANIPVKNGVVHLISKPLVVIDSTVYETLKADSGTGSLKTFFQIIDKIKPNGVVDKLTDITKDRMVTVFAPTNDVFAKSEPFNDLYNKSQNGTDDERREATKKLIEILQLHFVTRDITYDEMKNLSKADGQLQSVKPMADKKQLFFQEIISTTGKGNRIAVVDSGGTSALITQEDIGATNGVIHMVNQILGIGENTMFDRLRTDPNLRTTYNISLQERFSDVFKEKNKKFTFFAPYTKAWDSLYYEDPAKYHILMAEKHGRHASNIMQRHLIPGQQWSMEDLHSLSVPENGTVEVNTIRTIGGHIRIAKVTDSNFAKYKKAYGSAQLKTSGSTRFTGNYEYVLFWANKEVRVVIPNIKCSNGYIHIIDTVLMSPNDVFINSAKEVLVSKTTIGSFLLMSAIAILFTN